MFKNLKNAFLSGLVLLLPVGATLWVMHLLLNLVGTPASRWLFYFIDPATRLKPWVSYGLAAVSIAVVLILVTAFGFFSRYFFGRVFVKIIESVLTKLPFVKIIYKTTKQIVETFRKDDESAFKQVVLIEYPRPGSYAVGFLTSTTPCEAQEKVGKRLLNVFMPTAPNPTTGFLFLLPEESVTFLDMPIGDGMKLIISCGAVVPEGTALPREAGSHQP
jgi:uncharacterized membrane protein